MKNQIIIINLIGIVILGSCNSKDNEYKEKSLECILDAYNSEFSMRLGNELRIFESHGWTDTTVNLSLLSIKSERLKSGEYYFSEYNGLKLFLSQGELYEDKGLRLELFADKSKMTSNSLTWKKVDLKNMREAGIVPPEQFDEIQIIYNSKKKCIEETEMMGRERFMEQIKNNCGFCK